MIHLRNIHKTYHNGADLHVLKGIDLDIEPGEFVAIMVGLMYISQVYHFFIL